MYAKTHCCVLTARARLQGSFTPLHGASDKHAITQKRSLIPRVLWRISSRPPSISRPAHSSHPPHPSPPPPCPAFISTSAFRVHHRFVSRDPPPRSCPSRSCPDPSHHLDRLEPPCLLHLIHPVCRQCQHAIWPREVRRHYYGIEHRLPKKTVDRIEVAIQG